MSSLANGVLREPVSDKGRDIMNDQKRGESLQGRARPGNLHNKALLIRNTIINKSFRLWCGPRTSKRRFRKCQNFVRGSENKPDDDEPLVHLVRYL